MAPSQKFKSSDTLALDGNGFTLPTRSKRTRDHSKDDKISKLRKPPLSQITTQIVFVSDHVSLSRLDCGIFLIITLYKFIGRTNKKAIETFQVSNPEL